MPPETDSPKSADADEAERIFQTTTSSVIDALSRLRQLDGTEPPEQRLLNASRFLCFAYLRLAYAWRALEKAEDNWQERFQAAYLAALCVELFEDIGELSGGDLRKDFASAQNGEQLLQHLNQARAPIDALRKKNEERFRSIRNTTTAHFDQNANTLIDETLQVDVNGVAQAALELLRAIRALVQLLDQHFTANLAQQQQLRPTPE